MMLSKCWYWLVLVVVILLSASAAAADDSGHTRTHDSSSSSSNKNKKIVQQLESSLLSSFGLKKRPQVKMGTTAPPYMLELFHKYQQDLERSYTDDEDQQQQQQEGDDVRSGLNDLLSGAPSVTSSHNTVRSFSHEGSKADSLYPADKMRLRFNMFNLPKEEVLHFAELRIAHQRHPDAPHISTPPHVHSTNSTSDTTTWKERRWRSDAAPYLKRIKVHDILRPATRHSEPAMRLLDTTVVDARGEGVEAMDVSDAVRRWMMSSESNNGLLIEIMALNQTSHLSDPSHVRLRRSADEDDIEWTRQQPLLVVYTNDGKPKRRSKRSAAIKHKKIRETCRRHRLHVNFRQVGWDDWIVAPSGYDAYFCKGECHFPLPASLNTTNHAVVQTLVNSRYPDRVPRACCVPTELSPISMLYQDNDEQFVLKNHQDMVVEGCGCR